MFYAAIIFIIVIVFLMRTNRGSLPARYMAAILVFYMLALFSLVLYLSKDMYYYNTANYYFALPKFIWKWLTLFPVGKTAIIRMCNFCVLSVIYLGIRFSLSFMHPALTKLARPIRRTAAGILISELVLYDPAFIRFAYYTLYPSVVSVAEFSAAQDFLHRITTVLNLSLILCSFCLLLYTLSQTSSLRTIRLTILGVMFSYLMIMFSYLYIFIQYPCYLIKVSKLADTYTYLTAPLLSSSFFYRMFPYFIVVTLLLISWSIYKSNDFALQIRNSDFSISRQIAASDVTSRTFCHFMKNELLAIEAELDLLTFSGEDGQSVQNVIDRCQHLYQRLDVIHRSTRAASLTLHRENLADVMTDLISEQLSSSQARIICSFDRACPSVMLDRNYFEQAVMNIITNALEAMQSCASPEEQKLYFSLESVNKWVILTIRDTGKGIDPEHLSHIFTPFYTSEPVARHWGIGLSLTHKIIAAHEGHIEVESQKHIGTTFRIMLPAIR